MKKSHLKTTSQSDYVEITTTLYKAASFTRSKRFRLLLDSQAFRFKGDATHLFQRLRDDLVEKIYRAVTPVREDQKPLSSSDMSISEAGSNLSRQLYSIVAYLDQNNVVKEVDKSFTIPSQSTLIETTFNHFNLDKIRQVNAVLANLDTPFSFLPTLKIRAFLSELATFIECLNTLAYPTPYPGFERMLAVLFENIDYFVKGFPQNILASNAQLLRDNISIAGFHVRREYCESQPIIGKHRLAYPNRGFRVFSMKVG